MTKELFVNFLKWLSQFGGFDDLSNTDTQEELWSYWVSQKDEREQL